MATLYDQIWGQPTQAGAGPSMFAGAQQAVNALPPGVQRRAERPGLLDYVWGVAAGYNPNDIRRGFDERERQAQAQEAMRAQQAQIASQITDPTERALFMISPEDWAKNVGQQFAPQVVGAGAAQAVAGRRTVEQPSFTESGDTILRRTSEGVVPIFTRTDPSISEQTARDRLAIDQGQFNVAQNLRERQFQTGTALSQAELDIKQADLGQRQTEAQRKDQERIRAEEQQANATVQTAGAMSQALTRAREFIGAAGALTKYNPLQIQNRANLEGNLDTLKANLTFDKLMEMKASSPTGASGLGALSDNEARLLASTVASLSPDMSPQELERSFGEIDALVAKMRDTRGAPSGSPVRVTSAAEAQRLAPGTLFQTPDGRIMRRR